MRLLNHEWKCKLREVPFRDGQMLVSVDWIYEDRIIKLFSSFDNYIEFYYYQQNFTEKNFYEVIRGAQKPHFDIDCNESNEDLLDNIINQLNNVLNKLLNNPLVLIYKSRNKNNTQTKKSAHIVVDRYFHKDHLEAKSFYEIVTQQIEPELRKYLDPSVYSSTQQFRLLGSSKIGSDRIKVLINKQDGDDLDNFRMSLVSYTKKCVHISIEIEKPVGKIKQIDNVDVKEVYGLVKQNIRDFNFDINRYENGIIMLKNKGKYNCCICNRTHEHENPYILVTKKSIYYVCRRAQTEGKEKYSIELRRLNCIEVDEENEEKKFVDIKNDPIYLALPDTI